MSCFQGLQNFQFWIVLIVMVFNIKNIDRSIFNCLNELNKFKKLSLESADGEHYFYLSPTGKFSVRLSKMDCA